MEYTWEIMRKRNNDMKEMRTEGVEKKMQKGNNELWKEDRRTGDQKIIEGSEK